MCHVAYETSGFVKSRLIGMAGVLDSARFRTCMAMELAVSVENTNAFVLDAHGDAMVPLPRYSHVAGIQITEFLSQERIDAVVKRTKKEGGEIVGLLKTSSAYCAPGSATVEMVEAILKHKKKILPCVTYIEGEYGIKDLFVRVAVKLDAAGVEEIIEIRLTSEESEELERKFADSAAKVVIDAK